MAKVINKSRAEEKTVKAGEQPAETVEEVEEVEEVEKVEATSGSGSDSDIGSESEANDEEIEGLSSDEEADVHKIKKLETKKQNNGKAKKASDYSGILYVSRLPHGFQERELSKYFAQFGDLKEVKLARNKKSGNSRHYGFIEFVNKDDAKIAQETMNNYLLMGHLLQVRLLAKGSKIEKLYRHKKRAFMQADIKKPVAELKENAKKKHDQRMEKLAQSGIEFKW